MIFDKQTMFSDGQAVTTTAFSTSILDCGPGEHKACTPPWLVVFLNGYSGAGSFKVEVQTCANAEFDSEVKTIAIFPVDNATLLTNGKAIACGIPQSAKRYLRLNYDVTAPMNDGKIIAGLVADA